MRSLNEEAKQRVEEIERADILVGIPSFENERTIAHVVRAVQYGLAKYFPKQRSVIMNSDGGSKDRTRQIVQETSVYSDLDTIFVRHPLQPARSLSTPYHGIPGKGSAFKAIFDVAAALNVRACIVVDSDLRSISPEWVELLASPILVKGYDYVAPWYIRHKYDGTITNAIVYPLTRCLYGVRVRQPIGGEFGLSGKLVRALAKEDVWGTDVARFGIDVWLTTTAICEGFKLCQAFLGTKIHDTKDPPKTLGAMFLQVVGTLFHLTCLHEDKWKTVKRSHPTALYGFRSEVSPEPIEVDRGLMIRKFKTGVRKFESYWSSVLPEERVADLVAAASKSHRDFQLPVDLWVRTVYDFAAAYGCRKPGAGAPGSRLLEALLPIYFGRTASWIDETRGLPTYEAEERLEAICDRFEELKPYLIQRWKQERDSV